MINWVRGVCRISGWVLLVSNGLEEGSVREHDEWRTLVGDFDSSNKLVVK
jgi:hypothetical protein